MMVKLDSRKRKISYRFNGWKYIFSDNASDELYNLTKDPGEHNNLIEQEKEVGKDFLRRIRKHIGMEEKTKTKQTEYLRILNLRTRLRQRF